MEPLNRDRPETRLDVGGERTRASAQAWWQLGTGAAMLLMAGGGVSPRTLVRAAAVAGGAALVYRALAGPQGLLARHGAGSAALANADTSAPSSAASGISTSGSPPSAVTPAAADVRQEEPSLAGSDIPPIDLRGA